MTTSPTTSPTSSAVTPTGVQEDGTPSASGPTKAPFRRVVSLLARMAIDARLSGAIQLGLTIFRNASAIANAVLLKQVIDAIATGDPDEATRWGLAMIALLAAEGIASLVGEPAAWLYSLQTRGWVDQRLVEANAENHGIQHLEHPGWRDALTSTFERRWMFNEATWDLLELTFVLVSLAVSLVVLAPIHPGLIAVVLVAGFVNVGQVRLQQKNIEHWTRTLPEQRQADQLLRTVIEAPNAPEMRVLGAPEELAERHRRGMDVGQRVDRERERAQILLSLPTSIGEVAAIAAGLWLVANQVRAGAASAGDVALVLTLLRNAVQQLNNVWFSGAWLLQEVDAAARLVSLLDYRSPITVPDDPKPAAGLPRKSIRFENVRFRYPDTERDVLDGLDLELPAGSVVAIVGDNGAGKTTIAKLLARLYDPTEGRITVDGIDLRDLDPVEWRAGFAAAFQDFARFELLVRETVGVGDLPRLNDTEAVLTAIAEGAAESVVNRLPQRLDAQLGRRWKGGHQLSAGQWQKLAIARSRMRPQPRVLVLDEPTAALDPTAEAEIFERFAAMTEAARSHGGVAVIVSHRFSTVRRADLIAVIGDGTLVEYGTHEELVAAGGSYSELWRIQAANYGR